MGLLDRLVYSGKFLTLLLLVLFVDTAYMVYTISRDTVIYGTVVIVVVLGYLIYYARRHKSVKEVLTIGVLASLSMIIGGIIGLLLLGGKGLFASAYVFSLTLALLLLLYSASRLIRV